MRKVKFRKEASTRLKCPTPGVKAKEKMLRKNYSTRKNKRFLLKSKL